MCENVRTNRAICALRQLWSGSLDGSLLGTGDSAWKASEGTPMGAELAHCSALACKSASRSASRLRRWALVRSRGSWV